MHPFEIINRVFTEFRGLPVRMAELFGNTPEWYSSWGRTPKMLDEYGTGNKSFLDHFFLGFDKFVAASRPAAQLLKLQIVAEMDRRIYETYGETPSQQQLRRELLKEALEAVQALDECDFEHATGDDLSRWDIEMGQLIDKATEARRAVGIEMERRTKRNNLKSVS